MDIPKSLQQMGFEIPSTEPKHRILIGSEGLERTGKTDFTLSAPDPIGVLNLDIGLEGVVEKWVKKGKKIWVKSFNIPAVDPNGRNVTQQDYIRFFGQAREAHEKILADKDIRTESIDTGSELWELGKLAEFGRIDPKVDMRSAYTQINQLFRSLIRRAYETDKNLIITHKNKAEYVTTIGANGKESSTWDGKKVKKMGFGEENYLIQANIVHAYEDGQFSITVKNSRHNMNLAGFQLFGAECTFTNLAMIVFPGTSEKDWK